MKAQGFKLSLPDKISKDLSKNAEIAASSKNHSNVKQNLQRQLFETMQHLYKEVLLFQMYMCTKHAWTQGTRVSVHICDLMGVFCTICTVFNPVTLVKTKVFP